MLVKRRTLSRWTLQGLGSSGGTQWSSRWALLSGLKNSPQVSAVRCSCQKDPPAPSFPLPRNMDWPQWGLLVCVLPSPHPASL